MVRLHGGRIPLLKTTSFLRGYMRKISSIGREGNKITKEALQMVM